MTERNEKYPKEGLKAHILYKLARKRRWGGKHTEIIHVRSALPQKYRNQAEELAKELISEGFLIQAPKTGEIHVSLNTHKKKEIIELVEKYMGDVYW